jgi:hypothetical protein
MTDVVISGVETTIYTEESGILIYRKLIHVGHVL